MRHSQFNALVEKCISVASIRNIRIHGGIDIWQFALAFADGYKANKWANLDSVEFADEVVNQYYSKNQFIHKTV
jgi:hypothetical protein